MILKQILKYLILTRTKQRKQIIKDIQAKLKQRNIPDQWVSIYNDKGIQIREETVVSIVWGVLNKVK